ncbi:histidine kinase dimerization/phosphoacceptor domain -containing protein [Parvularcula sp. LCG005]|uniref:histidine kinase dimerization/phosphoacceptor domain -containing protein n=1 Tax=Parvularcula sp. LCG005 TaxID=3078805 RepID=UPI002942564E|nr:histidine kinase dimerization/phosphoacceptor domain -containing protein [Parvularcula sp. LCG005]WOI54407.1 histidine kinase dimerization/phosphoacceptor domain -containing protein [Parvularcula sp. LCG005]
MKARHHPRQADRLATLHSYGILDTPRESDFDDIVALASEICGTPISVINFIDAERQWFKAEVGLNARETPLETSICSHVILEQDFTMIEDTQMDPRTLDNNLCTPVNGLRFYAGALLTADNGLPIGTLCVLDTVPKRLTDSQIKSLKVLARRVMRELDFRRVLAAQQVLRDEIDHRVKNSLASVSSAISLYKREALATGDPATAFDNVKRHLDAISSVHKALYSTGEGKTLDLRAYFTDLVTKLQATLPSNVSIEAHADSCSIPADLANTIGLIANEFAANTVKHGMGNALEAKLSYNITIDGSTLNLAFSNNVPEAQHSDSTPAGIGYRLMTASVWKLGGTVSQAPFGDGFRLQASLPVIAVAPPVDVTEYSAHT